VCALLLAVKEEGELREEEGRKREEEAERSLMPVSFYL
jgi:hypothetical protein